MDNQRLILSPYTFLFDDNGNCYLFNSESLFFSRIDRKLYLSLYDRDLENPDKDTLDFLKEKRIIISAEERYNCYNHLKTRHLTSAYGDDTMSLIIAPTTACNFACPYCFEPKKNPKTITKEVEDKLIEYINNQTHIKNISLTWYGGEPLLVPKTIRRIYDRIISETEKTIISHEIISNTFLVDDEVIKMLGDIKINTMQVSIDGTKDHHDATRFLKADKSPTFETIERNIEKIAKALPELHISIRVNIRKENWRDFVELYHKYHGEDWHANIGLYPGIIREDSSDGCRMKHSCFQLSDLPDLYFKLAENGVNVNFFPANRFKGCMLQRANAFIVGPEGELYKCWNDVSNPEKRVGSIMDNKPRNYTLLMRYMHECGPIMPECRDCHVYPVCDGGCGQQQYRNRFENGEFQLCTPLKDKENLKRILLYCSRENPNKENKRLNFGV